MVQLFMRGFLSGTTASVTCYALYYVMKYTSESQTGAMTSRNAGLDAGVTEDVKNLEQRRQVLKYGVPDTGPAIRSYNDHVVAYDQSRKTPIWVAEHIHQGKLKGSANRKKSYFKPDPDMERRFSASNDDYYKSGWSRGHMAPAGNYKHDQLSMDETFYLTNIVPQDFDNNSGFWNRFEMYCRDLTRKFNDVRIISGPVILPKLGEDGKLYVKYQVIGEGQVAVPTHLFKVIVAENGKASSEKYVGAFIVPNEPLGPGYELQEFEVDLDFLEMKTGVSFLPKLSDFYNLCEHDGCALSSRKSSEFYNIKKRLEGAKSLHQLEKSWTELHEKNIPLDNSIKDLYENRKNDLTEKAKLKHEL